MVRKSKQRDGIITEALERFDRSESAEHHNREMWLEDMRFVHDEDAQWTQESKDKRKGRPCMTFDKTSQAIDQMIGDQLINSPSIKIRGFEDDDADTAEIYTGLIRSILNKQEADRAQKTAYKHAVTGGFGVMRILNDYADDECFDQDIMLKAVENPCSVYWDADAKLVTKEDGMFFFIVDDMSLTEFERAYPKASVTQSDKFSGVGDSSQWFGKDNIRVAEYFRKVPKKRTIYQLSDGSVVDEPPELDAMGQVPEFKSREVDGFKIEIFKITGSEILEESEWTGKYLPIIPVFGKVININGEFKYRGAVRKAKDAQRTYNMERSNYIETVALQPKQPYLVTGAMLKGHEKQWSEMNTSNRPALTYNLDQGMRPTRESPQMAPQGLLTGLQISSDDIKSATGKYDASLGARSNETSGVAINARKAEGDVGSYEYIDELVSALEYAGRIMIDLIPRIYDTQRQIRILGDDDSEKVLQINKAQRNLITGEIVTQNDLSRGKYDVVVDTGASYATKRIETASQLSAVMAQNPQLGMLGADMWAKSLDLVGADEFIKRVRKMLIKQGVAEPTEEEQAQMPQPNPQQAQMEQAHMQLEMAAKQADINETNSKADLNAAKAMMEKAEMSVLAGEQAQLKQQVQQLAGLLDQVQRGGADYAFNERSGQLVANR